eukprot:SAG31_NODE_9821_length_1223_cov_1.384342_1_plen_64_part_10
MMYDGRMLEHVELLREASGVHPERYAPHPPTVRRTDAVVAALTRSGCTARRPNRIRAIWEHLLA